MQIPFSRGATPASSDRLAQRNLAVVESDNPGNAATHTIQHTLRVRPSRAVNARLVEGGAEFTRRGGYDELVFHWNDLPRNTKCTLYFPEWNMDDVLQLAALRQRPGVFEKVDAHTLRCDVADISYLPVVGGAEKDYAGLISLELPQGVTEGNLFTVDVQQYSGFTRRVTGSFQIAIPVRRGEQLLPKEIRKLAALRYIAEAIPPVDRWHPVFTRYLAQIENKIRGLGGNPETIRPSLDDPWWTEAAVECLTGKVCEVVYDCFGDFEGFVLTTCETRHAFMTKECGIEAVVRRACHERSTITVCCEGGKERKICRLILRCGA